MPRVHNFFYSFGHKDLCDFGTPCAHGIFGKFVQHCPRVERRMFFGRLGMVAQRMLDLASQRQCGRCHFCRGLAGTFCCVRKPPRLDPETGEARWPCVRKTDACGEFRYSGQGRVEIDRSLRGLLPTYADELGEYCKVPLTRGHFAKVDPEDYLWLSQFRWHYVRTSRTFYAVRSDYRRGRSGKIWMHREIMNTPKGLVCDHIHHNGLDNRKRYLRNCTAAQNNLNRRHYRNGKSRYRGVFWSKCMQMWGAGIQIGGEPKHLGYFVREIEAARAYDAAAREYHGRFANLNFPEEGAYSCTTGWTSAGKNGML